MTPLANMELARERQRDLLQAAASDRVRRAAAAGGGAWTIAAGTGLVGFGLRLLATAPEDVPLVVRRPRRGHPAAVALICLSQDQPAR